MRLSWWTGRRHTKETLSKYPLVSCQWENAAGALSVPDSTCMVQSLCSSLCLIWRPQQGMEICHRGSRLHIADFSTVRQMVVKFACRSDGCDCRHLVVVKSTGGDYMHLAVTVHHANQCCSIPDQRPTKLFGLFR